MDCSPSDGSRNRGSGTGGLTDSGNGGVEIDGDSSDRGSGDNAVETQVHLVIYAPRKGVVDVFPMRHGPPRCSIPCSGNCRLLQPPAMIGGTGSGDSLLLSFDSGELMSLRDQILKLT